MELTREQWIYRFNELERIISAVQARIYCTTESIIFTRKALESLDPERSKDALLEVLKEEIKERDKHIEDLEYYVGELLKLKG